MQVKDTGIGIPPAKLQTIFEAFTQVDTSSKRQYGGTGLGLAISAHLVRLMKGRIWAESGLGIGSTFHLMIPLCGSNLAADSPALPTVPTFPGTRALIVESNPTSARILGNLLQGLQLQSEVAFDIDDAALRIRSGVDAIDLVIASELLVNSVFSELVPLFRRPEHSIPGLIVIASHHTAAELTRPNLGVLLKPIRRRDLASALENLFGQKKTSLVRDHANASAASGRCLAQPTPGNACWLRRII